MQINIIVFTLNIWGIPFVSKDKNVRLKSIAKLLAESNYDVVSLQEVWSENDYQYLKNHLNDIFPHTHYFYSGVVGSGLCLFSKWPIISVLFHPWLVNGYIHKIHHGDWFGGKGVGLAQILLKNKYLVNVYITHLHAEYDKDFDDYKTHRVIQAFDSGQFIKQTRGNSVLQILAGDLNIEPESLAYRILISTSELKDSYNLTNRVGTHEVKDNSYTDFNLAIKNPSGIRIDHILYNARNDFKCQVEEYKIGTDKIPKLDLSFSDHESVLVKLALHQTTSEGDLLGNSIKCDNKTFSKAEQILFLKDSIQLCNDNLELLKSNKKFYITLALVLICTQIFFMDFNFKYLSVMLNFLFCGVSFYFIFMASLWNISEKHGILSGKLAMEMELNRLHMSS